MCIRDRAIIRSRVDESKTWTGTFTAVDTENREGNNNNMMYGGGSDSGEMISSSYPFYINLDTSDGLMLGQHVYIENDTGMEEKEGIWLDEGFIMDADKQPCVWVENKMCIRDRLWRVVSAVPIREQKALKRRILNF